MINTAFLDTASSFRCQHNTILPRNPRRISQKSKSHSTTFLQSTLGPHAKTKTKPTKAPLSLTPLESIIPEGTPMQEHGTPVGAVILPGPRIQAFFMECQEAFPEVKKIRFRGVENYHGPRETRTNGNADVKYKAIHVQTEVAASLVDGNVPSLIEFIRLNGGHFLPGVRMKRKKLTSLRFEKSSSSSSTSRNSRFTFVELFAGVGGFRLGLEPIGGSCVLASERDEVACAFYRRHFGDKKNQKDFDCSELIEGDVLDVVSSDFPPNGFDLLTAGFPCQPFSARGKKKGLDDDGHRGQMYQELVRILMEERPSFFLFENVVGLVTMDGGRRVIPGGVFSKEKYNIEHSFEAGRTMETVLEAFRSCGYKVEWQVVNCKHFCPQHRERVYFVGSKLEMDCPDVVWENIYRRRDDKDDKTMLLRDFLEQDPSNSPYVKGCELSDQQWEMVKRKWKAKSEADALTKVSLKVDKSAPTLISSYKTPASVSARFVTEEADGTLRHGNPLNPRFLTPIEFRRIMGFPDTFEVTSPMAATTSSNSKGGTNGIVDGHIYKVLGNAVVPSVIEAIGLEILRLMEVVETKTTTPLETSI